jgi:type VI secretion system protein ImpM
MPHVGDFAARGLAPAFQRWLDGWITRHLVLGLPPDARWPGEGLRFSLLRGDTGAAGLILPSNDRSGRDYPLAAMLLAEGAAPDPETVAGWIEAALEPLWDAVEGRTGPDDLAETLAGLPVPHLAPSAETMLLWCDVAGPCPADPEDPGPVLAAILERPAPSSG